MAATEPAVAAVAWSWNLLADWRELTRFAFMRNALWAAVAVGVLCGIVGWFVVLRAEAYVAHTLAMVAFPGAAGAAYLGVAPLVGYLAFSVAGAVAIAVLSPSRLRGERASAAVASVQAVALGLGYLLITLYGGALTNVTSFLFGSFLTVTRDDVVTLFVVAGIAVAAVAVLGRRLLFTSVDLERARAAGVAVGIVSTTFLVVLGMAVAMTSQFTGVLLVFALLVAPAATAQVLTARPALGLGVSVVLAVATAWLGLTLAYFTNRPVGWWVSTVGFVLYVAARVAAWAVPR
jgi:zinc/manganese transport system permease protein